MGTLASKLLIMGIISALGGLGLTVGPKLTEAISDAPMVVAAPEAGPEVELTMTEPASEATAIDATTLAQPEASEDAASERGHERRDAIRALNTASRTARELAREGGMDAEERAAMRTLRMARRDAIHALNLAHREASSSLEDLDDDLDEANDDDSASDHGRGRGPSRRMTHGR